jgi:hypothetical protein
MGRNKPGSAALSALHSSDVPVTLHETDTGYAEEAHGLQDLSFGLTASNLVSLSKAQIFNFITRRTTKSCSIFTVEFAAHFQLS